VCFELKSEGTVHIIRLFEYKELNMPNNKDFLKLCMISGSFEYDSEESLTIFRNYIEQNYSVKCTMIIYQDEDDDQSLEPLDDTDVLLVFTRRLNTSGKELERFKAYCVQGRPVVGVRTASHAFQNWLAFDKEVLGGNYQGHYGSGPAVHIEIAPDAKEYPILQGVSDFKSHGSLYKNTPIAADTSLLLTGKTEEPKAEGVGERSEPTTPLPPFVKGDEVVGERSEHSEPVAWNRLHRGGRVFYTSLGHQKDFRDENFLRLLANAVFWVAGKL
jgi:type 1 glutamine amidotransferase